MHPQSGVFSVARIDRFLGRFQYLNCVLRRYSSLDELLIHEAEIIGQSIISAGMSGRHGLPAPFEIHRAWFATIYFTLEVADFKTCRARPKRIDFPGPFLIHHSTVQDFADVAELAAVGSADNFVFASVPEFARLQLPAKVPAEVP